MKIHFLIFLASLTFIQSQYYKTWYQNLYCAGGFYQPDDLIFSATTIPMESEFSPIRFFIDYTNFDTQCKSSSAFSNICTFQEMIKSQLTKAADLMSQIVNVKHFTQKINFSDDLLKNDLTISNYDSALNEGISYDYVIILSIEERATINQKILGFRGDPRIIEKNS